MIKNTSFLDMPSNFKQVNFKMPLDNSLFSGVFFVGFGLVCIFGLTGFQGTSLLKSEIHK